MGHSIQCYKCGVVIWDWDTVCSECGADQTIPFEEKVKIAEADKMSEIYKCKNCGWKRPIREAIIVSDGYVCPYCLEEGGLEPTGVMVYTEKEIYGGKNGK